MMFIDPPSCALSRNIVLRGVVCSRLPNWLLLLNMQELNVPEKDVEELLVSLILDNRIHGHIDQVNRLLECGDR